MLRTGVLSCFVVVLCCDCLVLWLSFVVVVLCCVFLCCRGVLWLVLSCGGLVLWLSCSCLVLRLSCLVVIMSSGCIVLCLHDLRHDFSFVFNKEYCLSLFLHGIHISFIGDGFPSPISLFCCCFSCARG
jgi:hypothetical protein